MPHSNTANQGRAVIEEYLNVVDWCLSDRGNPGAGPLGYAPTLLLFSIVDAISHSGLPEDHTTRLEALNDGTGLGLRPEQQASLKKCFRHLLSHAAITAPGRIITDEASGAPFDFAGDDVTGIRVIPFRELVEHLWRRKKPTFDTSAQLGTRATVPPNVVAAPSSYSGEASGVASSASIAVPPLFGSGTP